jgi:iron(III) transport system permease protein
MQAAGTQPRLATGFKAPRIRFTGMGSLVGFITAFFALLLLYPLAMTVIRVFTDPALNIADLVNEISDPALLRIFGNTALVVLTGGALALFIGSVLAWIAERTDANMGAVTGILPLISLLVPPLAGVTGWVVLLDPRIGLLNYALRGPLNLIGIEMTTGPLNIYTLAGLILISGLYLVPYPYLLVSAALRRLDPFLEEASRVNHAGPFKTFIKVTLPAVGPSLAAAGVLAIIVGVGLFTVPVVIGTGARIDVLSVRIYRLLNNYPPNMGVAIIMATVMLIVVQVLLFVQRSLVRSGQHATISGRGFRAAKVTLGPWRYPAMILTAGYLLLTAVAPLVGLIIVSLQRFWTPQIRWDQLSFVNYQFVLFQNKGTVDALINSLTMGVVGATLGIVIAALLMLNVQAAKGRGKKLVDAITAMPATFPHSVIGVSFLVAFSRPPLSLYGTKAIILLSYLLMYLPFASRAASAAAAEVGTELAEASRVFGASERKTFLRILLPLATPGLVAGWIMLFIFMVGELTASSLLSTTSNPVVGRVLLDLWNNGSFPQLTAMALIMAAVNSTFVLIMLAFTRRSFNATVQ